MPIRFANRLGDSVLAGNRAIASGWDRPYCRLSPRGGRRSPVPDVLDHRAVRLRCFDGLQPRTPPHIPQRITAGTCAKGAWPRAHLLAAFDQTRGDTWQKTESVHWGRLPVSGLAYPGLNGIPRCALSAPSALPDQASRWRRAEGGGQVCVRASSCVLNKERAWVQWGGSPASMNRKVKLCV